MKQPLSFTLGVFLVMLAAAPSAAQTFLLTGALDDEGSPASGVLRFALEIHDDGGTSLWQEVQTNVVVVGGAFAIDVGAAEPLPDSIPAGSTLTVIVEDDALEPFPLATLLRVSRAARSLVAETSPRTRRVGAVLPEDVVTRDALATPGGTSVPVSGVADMRPDVIDGDNGVTVLAAGGSVDLEPDGTLALEAQLDGAVFASNSVSQFGTGALQTAKIAAGAITGAKVAANTLTRADLSSDITSAQMAGTRIFRVNTNSCAAPNGTLVTDASCAALVCDTGNVGPTGLPIFGRLSCTDSTSCASFNPSTCANSPVGLLVAP